MVYLDSLFYLIFFAPFDHIIAFIFFLTLNLQSWCCLCIQEKTNQTAGQLGDKAREGKDKAYETAEAAKEKTSSAAQSAKEKASQSAEATKEKTSETAQAARGKSEAGKVETGGIIQKTGDQVKSMAQGAQSMAQGALNAVKHTAGIATEDGNAKKWKNTNSPHPKEGY